jgi:hypothetical protein
MRKKYAPPGKSRGDYGEWAASAVSTIAIPRNRFSQPYGAE